MSELQPNPTVCTTLYYLRSCFRRTTFTQCSLCSLPWKMYLGLCVLSPVSTRGSGVFPSIYFCTLSDKLGKLEDKQTKALKRHLNKLFNLALS